MMRRFPSLLLLSLALSAFAYAAPIPDEYKTNGFAIGCQAYTFNRFTVFEAIEKTAEAGGKVIEFYPGQKLSKEEPDVKWDHNASDEVIAKIQKDSNLKAQFDAAFPGQGVSRESIQSAIAEFERQYLLSMLAAADGNVTHAAKLSGKERRTFGKLLKKHGIEKSHYRAP